MTGLQGDVQGAGGTGSRAFHDVEADHGGFHRRVTPQVLDGADIRPARWTVLAALESVDAATQFRGGLISWTYCLTGRPRLASLLPGELGRRCSLQ